ncbi:MAG TPA: ZIP family metal transporter, partial [Candidatus Aminicenantes bacterium]|nr:ZIP family metal transporter [Candidatus Aminicenantes bacterium]
MILGPVLLFALLGSAGAVSAAACILLLPDRWIERLVPRLVSYAIGTLLGASLLRMLPHALTHLEGRKAMLALLGGLLGFFLLESVLLFRHCHEPHCPVHSGSGVLILIGDAFHNFIDGLVIAGAFLASPPVGALTGFAVIAHEIPQE